MALITPPSKRQQEIRAAEREEDLREAIVDSFLAGYNKEGRMGDTDLGTPLSRYAHPLS